MLDDGGVDRHRPVGEPLHEPDPAARRVGLHLAERAVRRARRQAEAAVRAGVDELAVDHAWASSARMRSCSARRTGSSFVTWGRGRARTSSQTSSPARSPADELARCAELELDRRGAAFEHHRQPLVGHVERARHERRAEDRLPLGLSVARNGRDERRSRVGQRVQAQAGTADDAQRAARAAEELAEVVAGDVLHDLAARARDEPVAEHDRHAEQEIAHAPVAVTARPVQVARDAAADRRIARRVEREHLAVLREPSLQRGQPEPGLDGAREIAGLVLEHPVEPAQVEVVDGRRRHERPARRQRRSARPSLSRGC